MRDPRRNGLALSLGLALILTLAVGTFSCAGPGGERVHTVRKGENLYRIGLRYDVSAAGIARLNGIRNVNAVRVGTRLRIPSGGSRASARGSSHGPAQARRPSALADARRRARRDALREGKLKFEWPLASPRLTSRFGQRKGRPHEGIDLGARSGTSIRAAESGKVIYSGWLGDYGRVVIVKHSGLYRSVYAHALKLHVKKGQFIEKGVRIAEVGSSGRSTGAHLHFEIRKRDEPRNPLLYLP
ncbi:MAG: LysM peptidoglycan-binding domain-containing M23 family metallopeptidase [Myxococcota bacterium]|jgi:murein DD-endopeptidase MepM/ murein hydrolase activator NlpD|nr:LysM peptidoglycan-binding domain-containing M23 family metallopeptidase [Myxococcota bacterium]